MTEFGMMGGGYGMYPQEPAGGEYPVDPEELELMDLYSQMGVPEDGFDLPPMEQGDYVQARDMLGVPAPQLTDEDYTALAQRFGLTDNTGVSMFGEDPAYDSPYDITRLLGGGYEP